MIVERTHIGIFGKMNAGKSSVMNLLTGQETSIVDSKSGTTTDTQIVLKEIDGLGPVKIYDTAGADESEVLGDKKRKKAFKDLEKCDLVLLVIDPRTEIDTEIIKKAKQLLVIINQFTDDTVSLDYPSITIKANDASYRKPLLDFIIKNFKTKNNTKELLPFVKKDEFYLLVIDDKSPKLVTMIEQYITRKGAYSVTFQLNSKFVQVMNKIKPKGVITHQGGLDEMCKLVPDDIMLTTISLVMLNYIGDLSEFVKGLIDSEKVLIVEASKRSRIGEEKRTMFGGFDHNYADEFLKNDNLDYDLIIHVGGHMVSSKKILLKLKTLDIPYTDYGLYLAWKMGEADRVLEPWGL